MKVLLASCIGLIVLAVLVVGSAYYVFSFDLVNAVWSGGIFVAVLGVIAQLEFAAQDRKSMRIVAFVAFAVACSAVAVVYMLKPVAPSVFFASCAAGIGFWAAFYHAKRSGQDNI